MSHRCQECGAELLRHEIKLGQTVCDDCKEEDE